MLSAVMLLAPGCERRPEPRASREEPVRRAAYRSLLARDFLASCPAGRGQSVPPAEAIRYQELKRLAFEKGAGHAVWLGENDFAAVRRLSRPAPCAAGGRPYRAARAGYGGALDVLAGRIAEYRP
jgi:hypothetical protein